VVTALIAGSIGYVIGDQHSRIEAAAAGANAAAGCGAGQAPDPAATSAAGTALLARVLPMPSGATLVNGVKQGQLSLDDYVNELYSSNPGEKQRLAARCFQVAVHREWSAPSGTAVSIWLIQFGSNAGARSYTLAAQQGDIADPNNTVKFTVPGVADGMCIAAPKLDQDGNTLSRLIGDRGNVTILIHVFVPAQLNNALAVQVLREQNARL